MREMNLKKENNGKSLFLLRGLMHYFIYIIKIHERTVFMCNRFRIILLANRNKKSC